MRSPTVYGKKIWGGARPQNLGRGVGVAFEGQTHIFLGGRQDIIFKKVLLFAHAVVKGLLATLPRRFAPSQKGAIFLGILPPGTNILGISPPPPPPAEERMPQEYRNDQGPLKLMTHEPEKTPQKSHN